MAEIDLLRLLFQEILKISPTLLSKYITMEDKVLYLLLIPHVILFLFIFAVSRSVVLKVVGEHKSFQYLLGIVIYIYLVYSGLYGTMLVPLFLNWLYIALFIGLFVFLISVIIHPARGAQLVRLGGQLGKSVRKHTIGKEKEREDLEKELNFVRKRLRDLEKYIATNPAAAIKYEEYKRVEKDLKKKLEKL